MFRMLFCLLVAGCIPLPGYAQDGRKLALLVGVQEYDHAQLERLKYTENDVNELGQVLRKSGYSVIVLSDSAGRNRADNKPTLVNIRNQLAALVKGGKRGDTVIVALSGHGVQFDEDKEPYFCPADARPSIKKDDRENLLPISEIMTTLDDSGIGSKLLLVDACRNSPGSRGLLDATSIRPPKGTAVFLSCSKQQRAFEHEAFKHGVFFHYVIKGLKGAARNNRNEVTWASLFEYVQDQVTDTVPKLIGDGARQEPNLLVGDQSGKSPVLARVDESDALPVVFKAPFTKAQAENARADWARRLKIPESKELDLGKGVKLELVLIPPGEFLMGSPPTEKQRWEDQDRERQHRVINSRPFYMAVTETTQEQYEAVIRKNPSHFRNSAKHPVENVSWDDADAFCKKIKAELPTSAQWEYACRAGTTTVFHFGDELNGEQANSVGTTPYGTSIEGPNKEQTEKVASYKPNAFGLYDMHGNVWEWCRDYFAEKTDDLGEKDPERTVKHADDQRVLRGGGWLNFPWACRSAMTFGIAPDYHDFNGGFRIAVPLP